MSKSEEFEVELENPGEKYGFTMQSNIILTSTILTPVEKTIIAVLRRYGTMPNGAHPSIATICSEANISRSTYNRAIKTFVYSSANKKPKVRLITCIHRPNATSKFKFHTLTDELIQKLKPVITMSQEERDERLEKFQSKPSKKSKQSTCQNDTPIDISRENQNDTPKGCQNDTPVVSNRHTNNIDLINIEQQQQTENQDDVVVSFQNEIKEHLQTEIPEKTIKALLAEVEKNGKDLRDYIHYVKDQVATGKVTNPAGYLRDAVTNNWSVPSLAELEMAAAKEEARKSAVVQKYDQVVVNALIARGIDPKKVGYQC